MMLWPANLGQFKKLRDCNMWTNNNQKLGSILTKKIDNYQDCSRKLD